MVAPQMVQSQHGRQRALTPVFQTYFYVTGPISVPEENQQEVPLRAGRARDGASRVFVSVRDQLESNGFRRCLHHRDPVMSPIRLVIVRALVPTPK